MSAAARRRTLFVLAHPDDESLACGGSIARLTREGHDVVLACVTRGQKGHSARTRHLSDDELGAAREQELRAAAEILGIAKLIVLDHRDGLFPWKDPQPLFDDLHRIVAEERPDAIVTFGADGLYWHPDHCEVSRHVTAVTERLHDRAPPLYYVTMRWGEMEQLVQLVRASNPAADPDLWGVPPRAFGVYAAAPTLVVDVTPFIGIKLAALRAHRSQLGPTHPLSLLTDEDARLVLGTEYFRLAPRSATCAEFFEALGRAAHAAPSEAAAVPPAASTRRSHS